MPKITKNGYDLKSTFKSTITDDRYTNDDADKLLVWVKGESTSALIDNSNFARTITEVSLQAVNSNTLNNQTYIQQFNSVELSAGANSHFRAPDSNDLSFTDGTSDKEFSISVWFNVSDLSSQRGLVSKGSGNASNEYLLTILATGALELLLWDASSSNRLVFKTAAGIISTGRWYHVVATYDGSKSHLGAKIYVNGVSIPDGGTSATDSGYAGMENLTDTLRVGSSYKAAMRFFHGDIAEVAMWSKKISPASVTALYHRKGYSAYESGFLNNPVRTIIRDRDNRAGAYPTIHRMNRKGATGILPNTVFDDTLTVKFGNSIHDDFLIEEENVFQRGVDTTKWKAGNPEVTVKREFDPRADLELTTGAVVLAGPAGRWLQTANKVNNPTLVFSLLQGPYNNTGALARFKLNLGVGAFTDVFKVQIATNPTGTWTDVPLKNIHLGTNDVWADSLIVNETSKHVVPRDVFQLRKVFTALGLPSVGDQFKAVLKFKLDIQDFAATGIKEPFYIRFIQPSISDATTAVWAIGNVNIISRDEQVTYPYLGKRGDKAARYHLSQSIATPNFINSLTSVGSSKSGITDAGLLPFDGEKITPFNEDSVIDVDNSAFFRDGVSETVLPGFSSPVLNKTMFQIDLSPQSEIDVGNITIFEDQGTVGSKGPRLMTYWNHRARRWEKIGQPIGLALNNKGGVPSVAKQRHYLTSSAVGFGPNLMAIGSSSDGETLVSAGVDLFSKDALVLAGKPVDTFAFPYGPQYHATSSLYVTARDLGITKPFLLEKTSLVFDIKLELAGDPTGGNRHFPLYHRALQEYAFSTNHAIGDTSKIRGLRNVLPTFFILRQRKDTFRKTVPVEVHQRVGAGAGTDDVVYTLNPKFTIPGRYAITSGSNEMTYVDTSRELITYKQPLFTFVYNNFWSATNGGKVMPFSASHLQQFGYPGDSHTVIDPYIGSWDGITNSLKPGFVRPSNNDVPTSFTGSNIEMHAPVKTCTTYPPILQAVVTGTNPTAVHLDAHLQMGKSTNDRCRDMSTARGIVNNFSSFTLGEPYLRPNVSILFAPIETQTPKYEDIEKTSPYLILPDDQLIFGWQYQLPQHLADQLGRREPILATNSADTTSGTGFNKMTLFGNSKLVFYGSQIKNGKEFHEGLNQNLTSDSLHEVIGNEPVLDQFQVATRGELTGSISEQFPLSLRTKRDSIAIECQILGRIIVPDTSFDRENITRRSSGINFVEQRRWFRGMSPENRVAAYNPNSEDAVSLPFAKTRSVISINSTLHTKYWQGIDNYPSSYGREVTTTDTIPGRPPKHQVGGTYIQQVQRFLNLTDTARTYRDSIRQNLQNTGGHKNKAETSYGSYQNYCHSFGQNLIVVRLGGSPKYYFNNKHYGYFSDNVRQGLDGRFRGGIQEIRDGTVFEPAVRVKFVEDSFDEENLNFRKFTLIKPEDVDNTAYETFQSSNLSIFVTSSLPFKEGTRGSVNDDVPTNRNYGPTAVEIST